MALGTTYPSPCVAACKDPSGHDITCSMERDLTSAVQRWSVFVLCAIKGHLDDAMFGFVNVNNPILAGSVLVFGAHDLEAGRDVDECFHYCRIKVSSFSLDDELDGLVI